MFTEKNTLNFIDLFSGAGGLSEGFFNHSFNPIAHVEMNTYALVKYKTEAEKDGLFTIILNYRLKILFVII